MQTILTAQDWARQQEIFHVAVELPTAEQVSYLDETCKDDPALLSRIESLLRSVEEDTGIHQAVGRAAASSLRGSLPAIGDRLGPYQITGVIGQGGMGVVYCAIRADDEYNKEVAIKVAAFGLLTPGLRHRFLRERQILANLDHPNIARLLDGGTTPDGAPFVVMELVAGQLIDKYCAENGLTRRARISLMIEVARAVDYAHRHLVVHRDLKPDNILVTQDGDPKLLDFGIAKALNPEAATADGVQTVDAARLMTPDYASPEQVRGGAITTATDVYQLGVLLYLLLVGKRPFETANASMSDLEKAICETPPPKPDLDADLDRILLQALEKDPGRRYISAGLLAEDLQHFLDGYPVQARKASWPYATSKFVQRHRLGAAAVAALALLLIGVSIAMTVLARRAKQQARIASQQASLANQSAEFLLGLLKASDPVRGRGDKRIAEAYQIQRNVLYSEQATLLPHDPALCDAWETLEQALDFIGNLEEQEQDQRNALSVCLQSYEEGNAHVQRARYQLGFTLLARGRYEEGEVLLRQALTGYEKLYGPTNRKTALTADTLGRLLREDGRTMEALELTEGALQADLKTAPDSLHVVEDLRHLAQAEYAAGNFAQASQAIEKSIGILHRKYSNAFNYQVVVTESMAAEIRAAQNDLSAAERVARHALNFTKAFSPLGVLDIATAQSTLGWIYSLEGKGSEGCPLLQSALTVYENEYGPKTAYSARVGIRLAACDARAGMAQEADDLVCKYGATLLASHDGTYRVEQRWLRTHASPPASAEPQLLSKAAKMQPCHD